VLSGLRERSVVVEEITYVSVALFTILTGLFTRKFLAEGVGVGVGDTSSVLYGECVLAHEVDPSRLLADEVLGGEELRERGMICTDEELATQ